MRTQVGYVTHKSHNDPKRAAAAPIEYAPAVTEWANRIVGEGVEPPDQLMANPRNWRIHPGGQQDTLSSTLQRVGWIQRVIVNRVTGNVIDGHLRVAMAISEGVKQVPVVYVELDEEEEAIALATFDPIGAMAVADTEALGSLLLEITDTEGALTKALEDLAADGEITSEPHDRADSPFEFQRTIELRVKADTYARWQARAADFDTDDEFATSLLDG